MLADVRVPSLRQTHKVKLMWLLWHSRNSFPRLISLLSGLQKGVTPVSERGCIFESFMFMLAAVCGNTTGWIVTGQTVET